MISSSVLPMMLMLLALSAVQEPEEGEPMNVYLFARTVGEPLTKSEKKAREKGLKNKKKEAKRTRKELEKKLKAEYGKDRDRWPEGQQEVDRVAQEAEPMAQFALDYLFFGAFADGKQKALDDSAANVVGVIQGKGVPRKKRWISLVRDRDQAHLLVEIFDRMQVVGWGGSTQSVVPFETVRIAVRVFPGEALRSNRLDNVSPKKGTVRDVEVKHAFHKEEPYWIFECRGDRKWGTAEACIAGTIDAFIRDNRAALLGDVSTQ